MDSVKVDTNGHAVDKEIEYRKMLNKSPHTSPNHYEEPVDSKNNSFFNWHAAHPYLLKKKF